MRTSLRAVVLMVVAFVAAGGSAEELLSDPEVVRIFAEVLRRGSFGMHDEESAAFLIRTSSGAVRCLAWPATAEFHAATYRGSIPAGAFAIVHTHPVAIPWPSPRDRSEARRISMPIFVLTLQTIFKADVDGTSVAVVWNRRWANGLFALMPKPQLCPYPMGGIRVTYEDVRPALDLNEVCGNRLSIPRGDERACGW